MTDDLDVGDVVHKVGRATGVRHGRVTAFELDGVAVEYDIGIVSFDDPPGRPAAAAPSSL